MIGKFEGFLRKWLRIMSKIWQRNPGKYGEDMINNSNAKILSMNLEQYAELENLLKN